MKIKRPLQVYDLIEIWWDDATSLANGWKTHDEFMKEALHPEMVLSVGFVLSGNGDHLVIAMDVDKDGSSNQRSQVPMSMIKKIKVLRKADSNGLKGKIPNTNPVPQSQS